MSGNVSRCQNAEGDKNPLLALISGSFCQRDDGDDQKSGVSILTIRYSGTGQPKWRRWITVLTAVAVLTVCVGCGSTEPAPTRPAAATTTSTPAVPATPSPGLSHTEFVRRLDATCTGDSSTLTKAADAAGDDTGRLAIVTARYAGVLRRNIHRQATLAPPPEDRRAFVRYLSAQRRMAGVFERMTDRLRAGDLEQVRYFLGLVDGVRADRTRAALDLGLRRCGA